MSIKKSELINLIAELPSDAEILIDYDGYCYPAIECSLEVIQGKPIALIHFEAFPGACNIPRED